MVLALAALAAAAASFPTGFGFGAGYGAGVRIGYDVIYPKIAPFAAKITDDIIGQVGKLFGGDAGEIAAKSGAPSGFTFATQRTNRPVGEPTATAADIATLGDTGAAVSRSRQIDALVDERIEVTFKLVQFSGSRVSSRSITQNITVDGMMTFIGQLEGIVRQHPGLAEHPLVKEALFTMQNALAQFSS